jgi:hypothetical protein
MPHKSNKPDSNRPQTRSKNADTHPGNVLIKASGRRSKQEIEEEKKEKEQRRKARETKKAIERASVTEIAKFENRMMVEDALEGNRFPRHQTTGMGSLTFYIVNI